MSAAVPADDNSQNRVTIPPIPEPAIDAAQVPSDENGAALASDIGALSTETNKRQFWGVAKKALGDASARVSSTGVAVASKAASIGTSGVAKATELGSQALATAGNVVDASGAKKAIKATASVVSEKLDEVSGKRLVELLEEKLRLQDAYNDVLATRLAEALHRISVLEGRMDGTTAHS